VISNRATTAIERVLREVKLMCCDSRCVRTFRVRVLGVLHCAVAAMFLLTSSAAQQTFIQEAFVMNKTAGNFAVLLIVGACTQLLVPGAASGQSGFVQLSGNFTYAGTFEPAPIDSNKDGLLAEKVTATAQGNLAGKGAGTLQVLKLSRYANVIEYGLTSPADAFTSCFRVNDGDFSVQENAYNGPLAHLIRPIRNSVVNPSSASYAAEEWTALYQLQSGELIDAQVTDVEICVENTKPFPICHVRQHEKIVGGTGRFKNATGEVTLRAIAPTLTSDAPLLTEDGRIDLTRRPPTFSVGPIHGAGQMTVFVPAPR